jgi:hypothetical protein
MEGARELLARGATRRARRHEGEDDERGVKRAERLERRLGRLFDRVDANDDGHIDASELTEALRTMRPLRGARPSPETASEAPTVWVAVSVTVAVQQYTRAGQEQPPQGTLETAA